MMVAVSLYDTLTFTDDPLGEISLRCNDPALPVGSHNLVVKALEPPGGPPANSLSRPRIVLDKAIPAQAGAPGGVRSMRPQRSCPWTGSGILGRLPKTLDDLAGEIGSDAAFFTQASGRGLPRAG